ncbi:GntR family transcriptional regulator [Actinomycetospora endophytica]|uniref:GntR family transcriptional regulator n=1 Tax=Actinomycetospora endophytica TaxID=2291215 RepID=A0ABS8PEV2_9PSEU|nr:GntR family transcriptional regulator [Actinomycetospora endophytica]MCD2196802.1 GntR family transcriptional regulator [Actinomycetospora endophytica]
MPSPAEHATSRATPAHRGRGVAMTASGAPSRTDRVYEAIVDDICTGRLTPGTPLRQERLAERFEVSRQPIQQALLLLRNQGLLRDFGRRGLEVAPVAADLVGHVYELRGVIDGPAARLAAERHDEPWLARATEIVEAGHRARSEGAFAQMIAADVEFHRAVVDAAANPLIAESAEVMWRNVHRLMSEVLLHDGGPLWVWEDHTDILGAIARRDGAEAEHLAVRHARHAQWMILEAMSGVPAT